MFSNKRHCLGRIILEMRRLGPVLDGTDFRAHGAGLSPALVLGAPLPLKKSAPPCSRKCAGVVGSTPSVRFNALALFFARSAASTRSDVNGDSCSRIPTAS